ncbi:hypothetical protein ACQ4PT_015447 [Festuca glaucescens]
MGEVLEDTDLVNRIRTSFWELRFPTCSEVEESSSSPSENETGEADTVFEDLDHNAAEATGMISGEIECLFYDGNLEGITKEIDELYSMCEELDVRPLEDNWIMDKSFEVMSSPEAAPPVPDAGGISDDVATLTSYVGPSRPSCFTAWKRSSDSPQDIAASAAGESQKLLKKVVAGGAWARAQESNIKGHVNVGEKAPGEAQQDVPDSPLVPSIHKVDKASILAETIAYLKELEQRVEELESSRTPMRSIAETAGRRRHDVAGKKASVGSKRKASDVGDGNHEREHLPKDDAPNNVVNVTVMGKEVLLELQCLWKELMMTRVFDALKTLGLDVLSVQSSTPDGFLVLKIRAQVWQ